MKRQSGFSLMGVATACSLLAGLTLASYAYSKRVDRLTAQAAALGARNAWLSAECAALSGALERVRAESAAQAERLSKAQAEAARARAQSEVRVQTILAAPAPDDSNELAAWAAKEARELAGRLE